MNMKIPYEVSVNSDDIMELLDNLSELADQEAELGRQIKKITGTLCKFGLDMKEPEKFAPKLDSREPANAMSRQRKEGCRPSDSRPTIIPFPGIVACGAKFHQPAGKGLPASTPILALPGFRLPANIPDHRITLQRDGLILLAWDKRLTEKGDRYTAYWVTSIGTPRFYASKPLRLLDFPNALPDHKSYAAEDGIEFYGQEAPEYIVHTAPELMKSNPHHRELRSAHIDKLIHQGYEANFNYKYLLKTEKKRALPSKKRNSGAHGRAS